MLFHSARASVPMAAPIRAQSALSKEAADEIESVVAEATPPPKRATPSSAPKAASSGRGSGQARWQYSRDAIDYFASTQALINAELSPDDDDDDDELESGRSGSRT